MISRHGDAKLARSLFEKPREFEVDRFEKRDLEVGSLVMGCDISSLEVNDYEIGLSKGLEGCIELESDIGYRGWPSSPVH